jgi:hypothetical protein
MSSSEEDGTIWTQMGATTPYGATRRDLKKVFTGLSNISSIDAYTRRLTEDQSLGLTPVHPSVEIKFNKGIVHQTLIEKDVGFCNFKSKKIQKAIASLKKQVDKNGSWFGFDPKQLPVVFKTNFLVFREKVSAWLSYNQSRGRDLLINSTEIFKRTFDEGPDFNLAFKKTFDYSLRKTLNCNVPTIPDGVVTYELKDINDLFPLKHLFPWELPEDLSDVLDYAFAEPKPIDADIKSKIKEHLSQNIKEGVPLRFFDDLDNFSLMDNKRIFSERQKEMSNEARLKSGYELPESINRLDFKISSTTKTPTDIRIIAIGDIPTRNALHIVRENIDAIVNCKYDKYGKREWYLEKILSHQEDKFFLMFDQSKAGWSFPTELIALGFEALSEKYPEFPLFKDFQGIFERRDIYLYINNISNQMKCGWVLGMLDNLASWIISCIFCYFYEEQQDEIKEKLSAFFYGDDSVIIYDNCQLYEANAITSNWYSLCYNLGIVVNKKKTFTSDVGVFLEIYGYHPDFFFLKSSAYLLSILDCVGNAINITHAKTLLNSIWKLNETVLFYLPDNEKKTYRTYMEYLFQKVISYWGYEFHKDEVSLPFSMGGWYTRYNEDSEDTFLVDYKDKFHIYERFLNAGNVDISSNQKKKIIEKNSNFLKPFDVVNNTIKDFKNSVIYREINFLIGLNIDQSIEQSYIDKSIDYYNSDYNRLIYSELFKRRQEAYFEDTKGYMSILPKLMDNAIKRKCVLIDDILPERNLSFSPDLHLYDKVKTFSPLKNLNKERARLLLLNESNDLRVRFSKKFRRSYLTEAAFPELLDGYAIPVDWIRYCESKNVSLKHLFENYIDQLTMFNIFRYCPYREYKRSKTELYLDPLGEEEEYLYIDPRTNIPIYLSEEEVFLTGENYSFLENKITKLIGLSYYLVAEKTSELDEGEYPPIFSKEETLEIDEYLQSLALGNLEVKEDETIDLQDLDLGVNIYSEMEWIDDDEPSFFGEENEDLKLIKEEYPFLTSDQLQRIKDYADETGGSISNLYKIGLLDDILEGEDPSSDDDPGGT